LLWILNFIYFGPFYLDEEKIIIDNKNNENLTKCWNKEKFVVQESCSKCDSLISKYVYACKETGYREILTCEKYGQVSRRLI
jgi:hypothetical protein